MMLALMAVLVLVVALVLYLNRKPPPRSTPARPKAPTPVAPEPAAGPTAAPPNPPIAAAAATPAPAPTVPVALTSWRLLHPDELEGARKQAMLAELRRIPRPPSALHQLVSPDFVAKASSIELSTLVMTEPLIAAKVLGTVNSPFYGLQKPVTSLGQAVTFLGLNTVRGIGLQYMLKDSFQAGSPELSQVFERIWSASALACELCFRLAQKLGLPEQGTLVTHMVLSFIGQLATYSLMPAQAALAVANQSLLERVQAEQAQLGLGSAGIGSLLMQEWGLPASLIDEVRDIDRVLVTPAAAMDAARGARLALCYLCARLGERLAQGEPIELATFDPGTEPHPDFFYLRSYLEAPALAQLVPHLQAPELLAAITQMQEALRVRA